MTRQWPPAQYPPREPHPNGDDLLDPVDWMTYSHRELYLMATTKLHPETARELSGDWLRVGRKLDEIADKLIRLNQLTHGAWEGAAAELARQTGSQLSAWADETGNGARGVADYLDRHASNAEWAGRAMPEPDDARGFQLLPNWRRDDPDDDGPDVSPAGPRPAAGGGTTPSSAGGIDFAEARFLVEDDGEARERRQHKHRRAAEIMTRMQANAAEIFGTIPRFTKPAVSARPDVDQVGDTGQDTRGATTASGLSGSSGAGTMSGPETQAPGARSLGNGQASGLPSGGMTGGNSGSGVLGGGHVRGPVTSGMVPPGAATAAAAARGMSGAMSGMDRRGGPFGLVAPGAGRRAGNDDERRSRGLLSGDATVFEPDEDPAPALEATDEHDEPPRSPAFEPPAPIGLDRLPGNWVRRGALSPA